MASTLGHLSHDDPTLHVELLEKLGQGSYGSVYKGRIIKTSELAAVKVLNLEADDANLDTILKEINILRECDHPNVVKYFGSYYHKEGLWIIMEYCGGGSIKDIFMRVQETLREDQISFVVRETLKGLVYMHSNGLIHRDMKGGNILVNDEGDIKLADFGVSAQLNSSAAKRNTFIGTPYWMAPEVIQKRPYDTKSDIWSLGITAIELAEGVPPHSTTHPMRVLWAIVRNPPPQLREKQKWALDFHDFVAKCVVKDPRQRSTGAQLQQHRFLQSACSRSSLAELVARARSIPLEQPPDDVEEVAPEEPPRRNFISDSIVASPAQPAVSNTITRRQSQKAAKQVSLQDLLLYRKDTTVRIPFLRLGAIPPEVLLDPEGLPGMMSTLELLSNEDDAENTKLPELLHVTPVLKNLTLVYAHRRRQHQNELLRPREAESVAKDVADLSNTLKMIFRI